MRVDRARSWKDALRRWRKGPRAQARRRPLDAGGGKEMRPTPRDSRRNAAIQDLDF